MKILASRLSLYEVEVDLEDLEGVPSSLLNGFPSALLDAVPSLALHKCTSGEEGGFVDELRSGTDMAHVLEHVILELQHLSDPEDIAYSGWTRSARNGRDELVTGVYVIHFQSPDAQTGERAARCALDLVKRLIDKKPANVQEYMAELRALRESPSESEPRGKS